MKSQPVDNSKTTSLGRHIFCLFPFKQGRKIRHSTTNANFIEEPEARIDKLRHIHKDFHSPDYN